MLSVNNVGIQSTDFDVNVGVLCLREIETCISAMPSRVICLEYATSCSGSLVLALSPGVGTTFRLRSMLRYSGSDFDVKCLGEPRMYALSATVLASDSKLWSCEIAAQVNIANSTEIER